MIRVHATKGFPVAIKEGNLPMVVFPPLVFPERRGFPVSFHLQKYSTENRLSTNDQRSEAGVEIAEATGLSRYNPTRIMRQ
jgi:hypothetical protein